MTDFAEKPIRVRRSILDEVSPGRETVQIRLVLESRIKGVILNFCNIYYLSNSQSNLISLSFLNNTGIYYDNEQQALYNKASQKLLTFTQQ